MKILFAPLDWGLGHATRCIPLIKECLAQGHEVILAASGSVKTLLQLEFPDLQTLELAGYNVKYAHSGWKLPFVICSQIPRLLLTIMKERKWLENQISTHKIDLVFSDNRYGLHSPSIPCILICHQLQIQAPFSGFLASMINKLHHHYLNRFNNCLVPDYPFPGMGGDLTANLHLTHVRYIGSLSRFLPVKASHSELDLLILLSGPEPQRSILEKMILHQLEHTRLNVMIVLGKPGHTSQGQKIGNIELVPHLISSELNKIMLSANMILCRAGYSSIMDLIKLNKRAILIPTPGQTEQEYLGEYLSSRNWFICSKQDDLDLKKLFAEYLEHKFDPFPEWDFNLYKKEMTKLLDKYQKHE